MNNQMRSSRVENIALYCGKIFLILILLGMIGVAAWVDFAMGMYIVSITWVALVPVLDIALNWTISHLAGDEWYNTGVVHDGNTMWDVKTSPSYYSRRFYLCLVAITLLILISVRYLFIIPINLAVGLMGLVGSIVIIIIYILVCLNAYKKSSIRHRQQQFEYIESSTISVDPIPKKQKKPHKFKFEQYPELLEKYTAFKYWNSKKYIKTESEEKIKIKTELEKSFDELALNVYDIFNEIKPELIEKKTGEKCKWEDVIYKPFGNLDYREKLILVRLLDRLYKYVLPDKYYNL